MRFTSTSCDSIWFVRRSAEVPKCSAMLLRLRSYTDLFVNHYAVWLHLLAPISVAHACMWCPVHWFVVVDLQNKACAGIKMECRVQCAIRCSHIAAAWWTTINTSIIRARSSSFRVQSAIRHSLGPTNCPSTWTLLTTSSKNSNAVLADGFSIISVEPSSMLRRCIAEKRMLRLSIIHSTENRTRIHPGPRVTLYRL